MSHNLCAICLSNIEDNDESYTLNCNHSFHTKCIIEWFRISSKGNCPCCMDSGNQDLFNSYGYGYTNDFISHRYNLIKKNNKIKNNAKYITRLEKDLKALKHALKEIKNDKNYKILKKKEILIENKIHRKSISISKNKIKVISRVPHLII